MTINAKIICDSISEEDIRIITLQLSMPRYILSEFNTHRQFSRNARSTRAIPTRKLIDEIRNNPVFPIEYGANNPGMQSKTLLDVDMAKKCHEVWLSAANVAADFAEKLLELGLHKQWAGRIIEPFMTTHVIVTSTEWENFFKLRRHPDAQPEIHALADEMYNAIIQSEPKLLREENWHLPYILEDDIEFAHSKSSQFHSKEHILIRCSVARCARVSYLTHDRKKPTIEQDLELYERLINSVPPHLSPTEHQACPDKRDGKRWENGDCFGNFVGWVQYRKLLEGLKSYV